MLSASVSSGCSGGSYCELESLAPLRYVSRNGMLGPSSMSIARRARSRSARVGDVKLTMHTTPAFGEQLGDFGDAAHVLFAIGSGHAEIGAHARADIFAVEHEHLDVPLEQLALERLRERGLAAARHAGQPDNRAAMAVPQVALAARDLRDVCVDARVGDDIRRGKALGNLDDDAAAGDVESVDEHEPAQRRHPLEQIDGDGAARVDDDFGGVVGAHGIGALQSSAPSMRRPLLRAS